VYVQLFSLKNSLIYRVCRQ